MTWTHLLAFNAALIAAMLSPGPAMLVSMRATLVGGRSTGLAVGAGLAVMASLWTLAALLGLDALFTLFPWAYTTLKLLGGAYLVWIAVQTWRHAASPLDQGQASQARSFLSGLLVNLANPKSVFFAAAVLVVIFPPDLSLGTRLIVAGNQLLMELMFYSAVALILSRPEVSTRYLRLKPAFDRAASAVLGGLGLRLILDRT